MRNNKLQKKVFLLAITAVPALIVELWTTYYFYKFYTLGHALLAMMAKSIFLPALIWSLLFIFSIVSWKKKWYWFVFIPLLMTYPWIYDNFMIILSSKLKISGQWYWTIILSSWTKAIFYLASLAASIHFVINKLQK